VRMSDSNRYTNVKNENHSMVATSGYALKKVENVESERRTH